MAVHVGDTPLIKYDCNETITDLSTTPKLHYKKPSGTQGTWTPTLSTQYAQYQALAGNIDEAGPWEINPELTDGTKKYFGVKRIMLVETPLTGS
jgi:hypothetical protein